MKSSIIIQSILIFFNCRCILKESAKVEPSKPPMEVNHEKGNSPFVASAGTKAMLEGETLQGSPPVAPYEKLTFIGENLDGDSEYDSADVDELHKLLSIERTTLRSNNGILLSLSCSNRHNKPNKIKNNHYLIYINVNFFSC